MERSQQQFPKLTTMEAWLAKAHPDTPALPWRGDDGREVCSLAVVPLEHTGGLRVVLFDAHGREVVMSGQSAAIVTTAVALGAVPGELTFLPAPVRMKPPASDGEAKK